MPVFAVKVTDMPTMVSGFAALAADPMALSGVILLVFGVVCGGYAVLRKAGG